VARVTGQRISSTLPAADTPREPERFSPRRAGYPNALEAAENAAVAWRTVTAALAGTPHVRLSFDGGRTYPARHVRRLPAEPPESWPCVVPVFDPGTATGRMLVLDLDPSRISSPGAAQRCRPVFEDQAAGLGQLLERLGARYLADVAPSGGRHIYVMFGEALPWRELRDLCRALALRFPAIDTAPMAGLGGQIVPPGSRHKSGGWRVLSTPVDSTLAAVEHPNGPQVWDALLNEFAGELQQVEIGPVDRFHRGTGPTAPELDDAGVPWVPRLGGRAPLGAELEQAARTGRWDRSHYPGRSEARMAVLGAAAARGWRLSEVRSAIACGVWKGLPGLYERASEPARMERLLPLEWRKAIALVAGSENPRNWLTSDVKPRPPADHRGADEFGLIRQWVTGISCAGRRPRAGPEMGPEVRCNPPAARGHRPGRDGLRVLCARVRDTKSGPAFVPEPADRVPAPAVFSAVSLTRCSTW